MPDDKKVTVTVSGGRIAVSPDPVKPQKGVHKVKWESDNQFTINLPGHSVQYKTEGSKHVAFAGTFDTVAKHKYDVSSPGAETLDPEVDVQPGP